MANMVDPINAVALVPVFDGENIPYQIFLKAAKTSYASVCAVDVKFLTALIRSKIIGKADAKIDEDIYGFADLEFQIETAYSGLDSELLRAEIKQRLLTRNDKNLYWNIWDSLLLRKKFYDPQKVLALVPICYNLNVSYDKFTRAVVRCIEFIRLEYISTFIILALGKVMDNHCWLCRFLSDHLSVESQKSLQEYLKSNNFHKICQNRGFLYSTFNDIQFIECGQGVFNSIQNTYGSFVTFAYEVIPDFTLNDGREFVCMANAVYHISKQSTRIELSSEILSLIKLRIKATINQNCTVITCPFLLNFIENVLNVKFDENSCKEQSNNHCYLPTITIDFVPIFNGTNMPVSDFLDFVRKAVFMTYEFDRQFFFHLIRRKLVGEADLNIKDEITCLQDFEYDIQFAFTKSTPHAINHGIENYYIDKFNKVLAKKSLNNLKPGQYSPIDALKLVPEFDGLNMSLKRFEKLSKLALSFVCEDHRHFMNLLICTKIHGSLGIYIQENDYTPSDILKNLEKIIIKNTKPSSEKDIILEKQTVESQTSFIVIDRSSITSEDEYEDVERASEVSRTIKYDEPSSSNCLSKESDTEISENCFSNSCNQSTESQKNLIEELSAASIDINELVPNLLNKNVNSKSCLEVTKDIPAFTQQVKRENFELLQKHIDTKILECLRLKEELEEQMGVDTRESAKE